MVEYLLTLADEYQAKAIFDLCVKCLEEQAKSQENAMKILFLTNSTVMAREDGRLDSVRRKCFELIKDMKLTVILQNNDFKNFDRDTTENVFVQKVKRLETFLKSVYPQFMGVVELALWARMGEANSTITPCPQHFYEKRVNGGNLSELIKICSVCRRMIEQLLRGYSRRSSNSVDSRLISIIQDFHNIESNL